MNPSYLRLERGIMPEETEIEETEVQPSTAQKVTAAVVTTAVVVLVGMVASGLSDKLNDKIRNQILKNDA